MKASELLDQGAKALRRNRARLSWTGDERDQALELLTHALGRKPREGTAITPAVQRRYEGYVDRRAHGEPIPYIVGYIEFLGAKLRVRPGAFVPRYTSEFLAQSAIKKVSRRAHPIVVDAATGVGPIALSVAKALRRAEVHGTDIAAKAVTQARANAKQLGLSNASFHRGDMLHPLPKRLRGQVDLVTSHPPYVPKHEVRDLPDEVKAYEPVESLTDDSRTGMRLAKAVVDQARDWLKPGGWLMIEIGVDFSKPLRAAMRDAGYSEIRSTVGDLKYTRVISGRA